MHLDQVQVQTFLDQAQAHTYLDRAFSLAHHTSNLTNGPDPKPIPVQAQMFLNQTKAQTFRNPAQAQACTLLDRAIYLIPPLKLTMGPNPWNWLRAQKNLDPNSETYIKPDLKNFCSIFPLILPL